MIDDTANLVSDPLFTDKESFDGLVLSDNQPLPDGGTGRVTTLTGSNAFIFDRHGKNVDTGRKLYLGVWVRLAPGSTLVHGSRMDINIGVDHDHPVWGTPFYRDVAEGWQYMYGTLTATASGPACFCLAIRGADATMAVQAYHPEIRVIG